MANCRKDCSEKHIVNITLCDDDHHKQAADALLLLQIPSHLHHIITHSIAAMLADHCTILRRKLSWKLPELLKESSMRVPLMRMNC